MSSPDKCRSIVYSFPVGKPDFISVRDAAGQLGLSIRRVHDLIKAGRIPVTRIGNYFAIRPADLAAVKVRKPGRPRNNK